MKVNITELLTFFDEVLPSTDEEQGVYWLKIPREDGIFVIFAFSVYENYVDIIVHSDLKTVPASIGLKNCSEIRVLGQARKCLEVLHSDSTCRCFFSMLEDSIIEYSE